MSSLCLKNQTQDDNKMRPDLIHDTCYMIGCQHVTLTDQRSPCQQVRERMSWFRQPTLIPNFWFTRRFTQRHFDWYQWLVHHQTNRFHLIVQPCISTPLWDHLIEAPWIGWWTNKKANHGTNGKGWKVFPINSRWGAGVGTSDQSEHENTVDTYETYFLVIVFLLSDLFF